MFETVEEAIAEAKRVCAEDPTSSDCKVAWDIVEELEAADSHQGGFKAPQAVSAADENKALANSFDVLSQKIDAKMVQLKSLNDLMAAKGTDLSELSSLADQMTAALASAKSKLP